MHRYPLARPIPQPPKSGRLTAAALFSGPTRLVAIALLALACAAAAAAIARADCDGPEPRSAKHALPALDARVDGMRTGASPARPVKAVATRAPHPSAVRGGASSTAPSVTKPDRATAPDKPALAAGEAGKEKATPRAEKPGLASKDARKAAPLDDDGRDVLGDLGRELRDLGRWLTEHDWE